MGPLETLKQIAELVATLPRDDYHYPELGLGPNDSAWAALRYAPGVRGSTLVIAGDRSIDCLELAVGGLLVRVQASGRPATELEVAARQASGEERHRIMWPPDEQVPDIALLPNGRIATQ